MTSQGTVANLEGQNLENIVEAIIRSNGYIKCDYTPSEGYLEERKCYMTNVPYTTIYKKNGRTEFVIIDNDNKIRVECKCQNKAGSVIEKLPYFFENVRKNCFPENHVILIYDGEELFEIEDWIKEQENDDVSCMTLKEFEIYLKRRIIL